ncbi:SDR family NAD(P)-dependent oxidoreductase [Castellaniella sp.]|uniref:SDR family NAD(P)-dependent oxidoreductase n=1 Tax=Castellaniella sp. TaxID=1955812 RepID=UPI00355D56D3
MNRFSGKIAVITGAAGGLGRDAAVALAREGARKVVLMDRDAPALAEVAAQIGPVAQIVPCDVADAASQEQAWQQYASNGALDVLLTAAGTVGRGTRIEDCSVDEWDRIFAVNVRGTFLTIRHALPALRQARGCVVTYGSTAGLAGSAVLGPYSASKGAVAMLTRSLALAHAAEGIRFNSVCPGSIDTPMLQATIHSAGNEQAIAARHAAYLARHPLGRFGQPAEVTAAALFLASDEASYLTGVSLPVDGGRLA